MPFPDNPLISEPLLELLLTRVLDTESLTTWPYFSDHTQETFRMWLQSTRRLAKEVLAPAYRPMDASPAYLSNGRVITHPQMETLWRALAEAGVISAGRPYEVGGQQLPLTLATLAGSQLMAANLSAFAFAGLTAGAAHLIEAFGDDALKNTYLSPLYTGRFNGTMALTEPQAGSSLGDLTTRATPKDGHYLLQGSKIFISGGDQSFAENTIHLTLARIDGAPIGTKGVSLFVVPRLRPQGQDWVFNDVHTTGLIHKIGWKGIPSVVLSLGENDDCHGYLVGQPGQGLRCMFQMMNEARIMVGLNAAATASVAYHESLAYAQERKQGRALGNGDQKSPAIPIIQHPDVRRMLLRQKAIVEGALCLLAVTARYADAAQHGPEADRAKSQRLLDLLTPIAKTFPSEYGFVSNTLAVQVLGGYGYSSEYLPESWLRDQKLNTLHEGTSGIQALDLLGRKAMANGGQALQDLAQEISQDLQKGESLGLDGALLTPLSTGLAQLAETTMGLGARGLSGDFEGMLGHAYDYLDAASILVVGWMWLKLTLAVQDQKTEFAQGIRAAGLYWARTELPRIAHLTQLCASAERSYLDLPEAAF